MRGGSFALRQMFGDRFALALCATSLSPCCAAAAGCAGLTGWVAAPALSPKIISAGGTGRLRRGSPMRPVQGFFFTLLKVSQHVFLGDAPALAAALHLQQVHLSLARQPRHHRRE